MTLPHSPIEFTPAVTYARCLTPAGRGAVATIRIEGDLTRLDNWFSPVNQHSFTDQPLNRLCYGIWGTEHGEDLVCVRLSTQTAEIHCHGGNWAVQRILKDLQSGGVVCSEAGPAMPTLDLQQLSPTDLSPLNAVIQHELSAALQLATTKRTAHLLLRQQQIWQDFLQQCSATGQPLSTAPIDEILRWRPLAEHLVRPWKVVLAGSPNVGKSSLINGLLGYARAVVFDQPGTTRDVLRGETALAGWPVEFYDTAGLRAAAESLEALGIEKGRAALATADLVLLVVEAGQELTAFERELLTTLPQVCLVQNKSDLLTAPESPPHLQTVTLVEEAETPAIAVSALTGAELDKLSQLIISTLIPDLPPSDLPLLVTATQETWLSINRTIHADAGSDISGVSEQDNA